MTNKIPTMFGFPLWRGKIKRRVAKKHLRRVRSAWMLSRRAQSAFAKLGVGDFINDCTGHNGRIASMVPLYVGFPGGAVLADVDFQTSNTGCSLQSCGVESKLPRAEVERRMLEFARGWTLDESGEPGTAKHWYGEDVEAYGRAADRARRMIAEIDSGGHVVDEDGQLLEAWKETRP
ncbi:MAG TPA: hypothetical protein VFA98_01920 [Thermoanaerobaculia bacterium]|nr:hypothetical protein [Thermoanaerobaculia bacterium]